MDRHGICRKHGLVAEKDIYTHPDGEKKCRICGREYMAKWRRPRHMKAARLAPLLERHVESSDDPRVAVMVLAERSGVSDSTIRKIMAGRELCRVTVVDRILCALGAPELWHLPADQGGFADIYERAA